MMQELRDEVIQRDRIIFKLETAADALRAQNRQLLEALERIAAGRMDSTGEGDVAMPRAVMMGIAEAVIASAKVAK